MNEALTATEASPRTDRYRVVFMGTPDFAVPSFLALVEDDRFDLVLAVSQPDRPQGRKRKIIPTPVHQAAEQAGVPCFQPPVLRREPAVLARIAACRPDFIVTAAYGKILPTELLSLAALAPVNVHASLLPLYRGASPVHNSIIRGDLETGVTIMQMVEAMDAGGIYRQISLPIEPDETADELMGRLAQAGAAILPDTLVSIAAGQKPVEQDETRATYVGMLSREDGQIDWEQPAQAVHNLVRGTYPWPGAYTFFHGETFKIHRTALPRPADLPAALLPLLEENGPADGGQSAVADLSPDGLPHLKAEAGFRPGQLVSSAAGRLLVATGGGGILELLTVQLPGGKRLAAAQCAHNFTRADRFDSTAESAAGED